MVSQLFCVLKALDNLLSASRKRRARSKPRDIRIGLLCEIQSGSVDGKPREFHPEVELISAGFALPGVAEEDVSLGIDDEVCGGLLARLVKWTGAAKLRSVGSYGLPGDEAEDFSNGDAAAKLAEVDSSRSFWKTCGGIVSSLFGFPVVHLDKRW